jgi:hypothetical protein
MLHPWSVAIFDCTDFPGLPIAFDQPVKADAVILVAETCKFLEHLEPLVNFGASDTVRVQEYRCVHCDLRFVDTDDDLSERHIATHLGGRISNVELVRCPVTGCNVVGNLGQGKMEAHLSGCLPQARQMQ